MSVHRVGGSLPDLHVNVNVNGPHLPIVCFEVGYSESKPFLEEDMRKLLIGWGSGGMFSPRLGVRGFTVQRLM